MTSGVKFCPEAHVAFDWSAPTYPFHYFEFVHWWCVSIYIWNNCIFGWFSVWKFITCLFLEMPRFFMFNFGAFQRNMHMASREKTSFACFLGHFILPRVIENLPTSRGSSLKWTVVGQSGRSRGVKLDGQYDWKWTVQKTKCGRSAKVDGPEIQKWTVQREMTL